MHPVPWAFYPMILINSVSSGGGQEPGEVDTVRCPACALH